MKKCFARLSIFPRTRREWRNVGLRVGGLLLALMVGGWIGVRTMSAMPGRSWKGPLPELTIAQRELAGRLRGHVEKLAGGIGERHVMRPEALEAAAQYIEETFREIGRESASGSGPPTGGGAGDNPGLVLTAQSYVSARRMVRNIVGELAGGSFAEEIVVLGAHYDSAPGCPAANDNASGVAALLEIARAIAASGRVRERTIRLVAFVNEEPPFFQGNAMGSLIYAGACRARGDQIVAMLSLETMGYYRDEEGSQQYPSPFNLMYPSTGNFIGFVGNYASRSLVRRAVGSFRGLARFPSEGVAAPGWLSGVGWSDHWSFWQAGYPALMVTDTALFRYPHYHSPEDTPEKLDYERLARVTEGLAAVTVELSVGEESE